MANVCDPFGLKSSIIDCGSITPLMDGTLKPVITKIHNVGYMHASIEINYQLMKNAEKHIIIVKDMTDGGEVSIETKPSRYEQIKDLNMNRLYNVYVYAVDVNGKRSERSNTVTFKTKYTSISDGTCELSIGGYSGKMWILNMPLLKNCKICKE